MGATDRGGARSAKDWDKAGVTADRGESEGKEEAVAAVGVEEQSVATGPQVCGGSGETTDQGRTARSREPGWVERPRGSGGTEGGRSQGGATRLNEVIRGRRRSHLAQALMEVA